MLGGGAAGLADDLARVGQRFLREGGIGHDLRHAAREQIGVGAPCRQRRFLARRRDEGVVKADRRSIDLELRRHAAGNARRTRLSPRRLRKAPKRPM